MNRRACIMWDNGAVFTVDSELSKKMLAIYDEAQPKFETVISDDCTQISVDPRYKDCIRLSCFGEKRICLTIGESKEVCAALEQAENWLLERGYVE